ncbi:hypothetical protein DDZ14_16180 [Maritimibacter sp. 55A14]|uniref:VpaChn25_0724 family phage protein n=1 Tax=Maritimibacter sp. 55A14 TaxID=2174844 RepID=UPI000D61C70E|nr:hypothetical protein [Maritimibacter sp. 55A14]PWE29978.1 hypothetical protein DDZ14_16180 [Maritimibacter sp. 55A14]
MDMATLIREQARLIVLKALSEEVGESLNSDILVEHLRAFAIRKDRAWLHDELRWLADHGAVRLLEAGSVLVAILTEKGQRHLDREIVIEGVKRPSRPVS